MNEYYGQTFASRQDPHDARLGAGAELSAAHGLLEQGQFLGSRALYGFMACFISIGFWGGWERLFE